ncbi:MAG: hypothetical protein EOP84_03590 [Verrucomicrobiaceae bacterium]|nr:MAG: hypothetical protein EOP84_03590 [Verrucomicrobiaceae bacterium]
MLPHSRAPAADPDLSHVTPYPYRARDRRFGQIHLEFGRWVNGYSHGDSREGLNPSEFSHLQPLVRAQDVKNPEISMFEFHGWAAFGSGENNREDPVQLVNAMLDDVRDEFSSIFEIRKTSNDLLVVVAHGLRNHRYEPVIELFHRIAASIPEAYGLLHVHDDEAAGGEQQFQVYRIARGRMEVFNDILLSPRIPTLEEPNGPTA